MIEVNVSLPLAFLAGLVSFLSPCVLPVVPSSLAVVTGLTLEEMRDGTTARVRARALLNSVLFVAGFGLVFMTLGWAATTFGQRLAQALPWINRAGGVVLVVMGLYLMGAFQWTALARERRWHPVLAGGGPVAALLVGIAFGAGWTPCIGPILGSILLYASLEPTHAQGTLLLGTYALGLGIPFVVATAAFNWFVAGAERARSWMVPLTRAAGAVLVLLGVLMVSGRFVTLTAWLAGFGQLVNLEM